MSEAKIMKLMNKHYPKEAKTLKRELVELIATHARKEAELDEREMNVAMREAELANRESAARLN